MWNAITTAFTAFIGMVGELVTALTGTSGALAGLLPDPIYISCDITNFRINVGRRRTFE